MKLGAVGLRWAALAVVAFLVGAELWSIFPIGSYLFLSLGVVASGGVVTALITSRKSRYDLNALREVHDRAELRAIEESHSPSADQVLCFHCGQVYSARFPACPHCGRR